jgi:acyl-coenzyme A synthetase/AMP-(fatty) acid ligase
MHHPLCGLGKEAFGCARMNIVDPILFQCRFNAPAPAICAPGTSIDILSYGRLERFIHNISRKAVASGLTCGQTVAILVQDKLFHATLAFGLMRLGIVTISARGPMMPSELGVDLLITDTVMRSENAKRVLVADLSWTEGDGTPLADRIARYAFAKGNRFAHARQHCGIMPAALDADLHPVIAGLVPAIHVFGVAAI